MRMATKCDPYHTTRPEEPPERNVYHNYKDCPAGKHIKPEHLASGTAGRPRCDDCKKMD
jgi:hypothetical protein